MLGSRSIASYGHGEIRLARALTWQLGCPGIRNNTTKQKKLALILYTGRDEKRCGVRRTPHDKGREPDIAPLHRTIDRFPTGLKDLSRLQPTQPPRPAGQKAHHRRRQRSLTIAPRNMLDYHPVLRALNPPWSIDQPHRNPPQRHELPAPLLQPVVARASTLTPRTSPKPASMGFHQDFDRRLQHPHLAVSEAHKMLHFIQNGLNVKLNG